jgi:hypothetical protein
MGRKHRRKDWPELVAQWESSGDGAAEFASGLGVHEKTLQRWKQELARAARKQRLPKLARIVEMRPARTPADDRFEVRLAGGRCVGVPASFDREALQRLLRVLEAAS